MNATGRGIRWMIELLKTRTFRSLRTRNYRLYFFGQIVSFTGSWMQSAALMWLVYDSTNDPIWPALLLVAQVGPTLLLAPLAGALADRVPKLRLIITTQIAFMLNTILLTGLIAAGYGSPWLLLTINTLGGIIQSLDLPTRLAFVPELVAREDLINAVSLNSLLFNSARAVGPALAGLCFLITPLLLNADSTMKPVVLGAIICFALNALSYAAVLYALTQIDELGLPKARQEAGHFWDGFRYVLSHPILAGLIALTGLLCIFGWPTLTLFPAYTRQALGLAEKEYSLLVSSMGSGALLAALTTATFGTSERRSLLLSSGAVGVTLGLAGLVVAETILAAGAAAVVGGFGLILFLSTGQSTLQLSASPTTRGRVMALWAMMLSASAPLGHLVAGAMAQEFPVRAVYSFMAAGVACCAVIIGAISILRGWRGS